MSLSATVPNLIVKKRHYAPNTHGAYKILLKQLEHKSDCIATILSFVLGFFTTNINFVPEIATNVYSLESLATVASVSLPKT